MEKEIPHRTALTQAIKAKREVLIERNMDILKAVDSLISITFDGWSKKRRKAFESLTVHFIQAAKDDPFEWTLHAHLLTFDHHRVGWFISNGVSVNDKATCIACNIIDSTGKVLKPKERCTNCIEHTFNLLPSHFCQALQIPSIRDIVRRLHNQECEELFDFDDDIDFSQEEEPDDDNDEAVEQAMSTEWTPGDIVGKLLAFVAQIRQCDAAMDYLDSLCMSHCGRSLQVATWVRTRWGSLAKCFDRMIELREPMNIFCVTANNNESIPLLQNDKMWINFKLSQEEWQIISLCRDVLKVTAACNAILGKEDIATSNWVIPAMHEVKAEWEKFLNNASYSVIAPAIQAGLNSMYKWYKKVTEDNPVYFICHVLDPRHRLTFLEAIWEQPMIDKAMKMLRKTFVEYKAKVQVQAPVESFQKDMERSHSYSAADEYMDKIIAEKTKKSQSATLVTNHAASLYEELKRYLKDKNVANSACPNIIKWWGRNQATYPVLSRMAAGLTDVARRGRMGDEMFEALQCLKGAYKDGRLSAKDEAWMQEKASFCPSLLPS
ncbi:hypothetical protein VKT23_018463 [Stygiomarasmius scandens]|uniref:HAT C-terminal dimerisation domain-containing protein n=1 Tax=Marasmiellus scandens TaxID=2682957 RepID=A0ABR1IT11_9AGAR